MEPAGKDDESVDPDEAAVGVEEPASALLLQALKTSAATTKTTNNELYFLSISVFPLILIFIYPKDTSGYLTFQHGLVKDWQSICYRLVNRQFPLVDILEGMIGGQVELQRGE